MIVCAHLNVPSLGVFLTCGLILSVNAVPARSQDVPPDVVDHDLGDPGSSLSIRLVRVPYYAGERLVLEATVRNTESRPLMLVEPRGLIVIVREAPDSSIYPSLSGINQVRHSRHHRDDDECLALLREHLVMLAPGETRTATWVSTTFGHDRLYEGLSLKGQSPKVFGVRISSHDLLPDRWLRFAVHRFRDPIRGQLLRHPVHKNTSFFFTVPAGPGRFVVLSHGSWYPHQGPYETFDAATLNRAVERWSASQRAIVSHPDPALAYDADGTLLVDGQRAIVPRYRFKHGDHSAGGWALPPGSPPGRNDSDRTPVRDPFAGP